MPIKNQIINIIIRLIGRPLIYLWCRTLRVRWIKKDLVSGLRERYGSVIFAFWHNRLFFMAFAYRQIQDGHNVVVMVSRSKDGEYVHTLLDSFGYETVRGSTSRGGKEAAGRFARLVSSGYDGCIAPDGPRGPRYKAQPGTIMLARLTGRPILPLTFLTKRHIQLKSWDGFYVPLPFSRGVLIFGEPVIVKKEDDEEQRRRKMCELEEKLLALNREAEELLYGKNLSAK